MALTPAELIDRYVRVRDRIKAVEEEHKKKLAPAKEMLTQLNNALLEQLNALGGDSINTPHGTAYRTEKKSATIADPATFRDYVIANEEFDLVDWKANAPAVEGYLTENNSLPPGITYNSVFIVGVRRA